jgi:putative membrane protein
MDKLIICIDRDDDIGEKAGEVSPIIGRDNNLAAVAKLGMADPEDSDINTIYAGIKLYDDLIKNGFDVEIVSIAGDRDVGLISDNHISEQLDELLKNYNVQNAIFVSDGAEDESILPIIESRLKVDGVHRVIVKQSANLESTWYILKSAFNDPKIANTFFVPLGLAALIYSFFIFTGDPKYALASVLGAIGVYMLARGFGLDDVFGNYKAKMKQSLIKGKMSFITYLVALVLLIVGMILGAINFWEYYIRTDVFVGIIILIMVFVNYSIWWFVAAGWVAVIGSMIDLSQEGKNYRKNWPLLFFLFSIGLLFWGASTFILSVSPSIQEYFISADTGRNLLVLSAIGAIIISLIGIWVSTRSSNVQNQPA